MDDCLDIVNRHIMGFKRKKRMREKQYLKNRQSFPKVNACNKFHVKEVHNL